MQEAYLMEAKDYLEERLEDQITWYCETSTKNQNKFKTLMVIQLLASLSIPILATNSLFDEPTNGIIISLLGLVVAFCTGLLTLNKYQENWVSYRTTAEKLKAEKFKFVTQSTPYTSEKDSLDILVSRVESLISKENAGWGKMREEAVAITQNGSEPN